MTSQQDQIKSLIADIERALGSEKPRKPWVKASDMEAQRQTLAQAQAYLQSLQKTFDAPGGWGPVDPSTGQLVSQPVSQSPSAEQGESQGSVENWSATASGDTPENVLQALLTEMKFLKSSALQPLRLEMDSLREERDRLKNEVADLSAQSAAQRSLNLAVQGEDSPAVAQPLGNEQQLNDFLQVLMERLQERLTVQVSQTLDQLESDHSQAIAKLSAAADAEILQLRPSGQIEELRQLQSRSDQLLVNIDSTLQGMFETLQKNIDSYQLSLNEGIENMHSLGRQGEVIVRSLVDHLTQQLGQTAPPEPAFYPARTVLPDVPLAFAEQVSEEDTDSASADAFSVGSRAVDPSDVEAPDTVASLDDILADVPLDPVPLDPSVEDSSNAPELAESFLVSEAASEYSGQSSVPAASVQPGEESLAALDVEKDSELGESGSGPSELEASELEVTQPEASQPEDCIREDGTIDLDLLKLDIDRSEDDETLTRDDLMIDARVADDQVVTVTEDPEIEAKVTPTADAEYLADLTLDDLVVDADLAELPPLDMSESLPDLPPVDPLVEAPLDLNLPSFKAAEETDLAAVLPDLGGPDLAAKMPSSEPAAEGGSVEGASEAEAFAEKPESALIPDIPDENEGDAIAGEDAPLSDALVNELAAASQDADELSRRFADSELDALTSDLEESIVFEEAPPSPATLTDESTPLESALIPDWPEDGSEEAPGDGADPGVESGLAHNLEGDAGASVDTPETPDDQSVFAAAGVAAGVVGVAAAANPFEASLQALESDLDIDDGLDSVDDDPTDSLGSATLESATPPISPDDFDDDLDFYRDTGDVATSASETSEGVPGTVSDELSSDEFSDLPPIIAPPFETPLEEPLSDTSDASEEAFPEMAGSPIAPPLDPLPELPQQDVSASAPVDAAVDPFATADLDRPPLMADDLGDDFNEGEEDPTHGEPAHWFLGVDLGTTGISAVLMNQLGEQVYPLCWNITGDDEANRFRLPAVVQVKSASRQLGVAGPAALQQGEEYLRSLKPLLKIGIPHGTSGEPWVQWSDEVAVPLLSVQSALSQLLATLSAPRTSCRAVGLKNSALQRALGDLKGVIVGYPNNWPDTYSFNVREAVLAAGLVSDGSQVLFIDEAIAALLSALPDPQTPSEELDDQQPELYNCNWSGGTVVISAGAGLTEAAVVDLPTELDQLSHSDFALRSFTYAGDSLDQDIICQLLHAPAQELLEAYTESDETSTFDLVNGWNSLGLSQLSLPQPGDADRIKRHRLRQRLNQSALGRQVLAKARELKLALQEDDEFDLQLADQVWTVKRKDLETKVFLPYIQRMNRQVNGLLSQKGMSTQSVKQVVCTGGAASLGAIARWLRQKFPNATIIQDTYSGEYTNSCSRVAYGLANLCNYPNVLDANRHQYNDYFLLLELLRALPDQPLPAGGILHLLEQRGINTQACQSHILALIEGHLPPGLVPTDGDRPMISAQSPDIDTYRVLAELPLFRKQGGQIYIADREQGEKLRSHLESILAAKAQSLSEPLTVHLSAESV